MTCCCSPGRWSPPPRSCRRSACCCIRVRVGPAEVPALADAPPADAILVDARRDLAQARNLCLLLRAAGLDAPVLAVLTEGGLAAVTADWGADDVILHTAGPAEVEARLRLAIGRKASLAPAAPDEIRSGELAIDEATYTARLRARALDLTFKEFELLKFLAQHPGRVFTRAHLLQEVWGYDYFGGTRTVDVHVRRLRAKLGAEHEALIGTVRNVGYRFVPAKGSDEPRRRPAPAAARPAPRPSRGGRPRVRAARARAAPPASRARTGGGGCARPSGGDVTRSSTITGPLPEPAAAAVLDLVGAASRADAVSPLSEHVLLQLALRRPSPGPRSAAAPVAANSPGTPTWTRPTRPRGRAGNWSSIRHTGATAWAWRWPGPRWPRRRRGRCGCGRTATCPRPPRWPPGRVSGGSARCGRCAGRWTTPLDPPRLPAGVTLRTFTVGRDEDGLAGDQPGSVRQPPGTGRLDRGRPGAAGTGTLVRPGRLLPGRAVRAAGRLPLDEDPPGGARPRGERPGDRSARCTWSGWTRRRRAPG